MLNNSTRPLIEGAMLTALTVIMAISGTALPMFFFLLYILPLPIAINIFRHGLRWGFISVIAASLITGSVFGFQSALSIIIITILTGPALGYGFRHLSPTKNLLLTMGASILSVGLSLAAVFLLMGVDVFKDLGTTLNTATQTTLKMYQSMGLAPEQLQTQTAQIEHIVKLIMLSLPAAIALSAIFSALINFLLTHRLLKRLGERNLAGLPPFAQWRMPVIFVFLFGFSLVGLYWGSTRSITILYNVSFNLNYFSSMFCRLQGLSLLYFILERLKLSTLPKILIMVLIIFTPFLEIFMYAGLFDMIFDYRTRLKIKRD
ncbi:YybS family protein [Pectinatus brassicae]|uniref:Uncharacterized protein YybS (DUF2232 family) n=1 Tax=Pectinatus brassicae TaxID=862415 RepID=A0A840UXT8_9FIRM|nr:DUF2232 domain-containing protein [Pectinatus brassicae]MBB5337205.1 uncharacterized protein YybS (DUF2232 family) [Pectinatus brassicae]